MNFIDRILQKHGLKYEELEPGEIKTLDNMSAALASGALTIDVIKSGLQNMRDDIENELCNHNLDPNQDLYLKARLRNCLVIESLLTTPEKARDMMERQIMGFADRIKKK